MLTGNEDMAQIYSFIVNNPAKVAYKELIKFRKRNNYFEILINLLQKALNEEISHEINEWCLETIDWLQKRNVLILGNSVSGKKKLDPNTNILQKPNASDIVSDLNEPSNVSVTNSKSKNNKSKRKIKKYKLLIPLDLSFEEKIRLEEKQKAAIDILYDLLPELYEKWTRKKKLRKTFLEESAFKSQFFVIYALSNFSQMMNRMNSNAITSKTDLYEKVNSISYLDPQNFLFDKANVIIMNFDELPLKNDSFIVKQKKTEAKHTKTNHGQSKISSKSSNSLSDEKFFDVKDTADLIADILNGLESVRAGDETNRSTAESDDSKKSKFSIGEFIELSTNVFDKFKTAIVRKIKFLVFERSFFNF